MKKQAFVLVFMAAWLMLLTACAPASDVVQVNTPAPGTQAGTPEPGGQIDVPGVKLQLYVPGPNELVNTPDYHGRPASFWLGIWHGIISPFTLVATFLGAVNVQMYEVHNDGRLYNLGFFLGVLVMPAVLGLIFGTRR
jgi:hypothetical protein